jgi:PTS system trehalose-specific IIC component
VQRLVGTLSEIFTPLLPAIIVGGLILGFRNILEVYNLAVQQLLKTLSFGRVSTVSSGSQVKRFSTSSLSGLPGQSHVKWAQHKF